jgi:type IV secretory pathway VirB6-like protein
MRLKLLGLLVVLLHLVILLIIMMVLQYFQQVLGLVVLDQRPIQVQHLESFLVVLDELY